MLDAAGDIDFGHHHALSADYRLIQQFTVGANDDRDKLDGLVHSSLGDPAGRMLVCESLQISKERWPLQLSSSSFCWRGFRFRGKCGLEFGVPFLQVVQLSREFT